MKIRKHNGELVDFEVSKIQSRIEKASEGLRVDPDKVLISVTRGIVEGMSTYELDDLVATTAASMTMKHSDYSKLASAIEISKYHKYTESDPVKLYESLALSITNPDGSVIKGSISSEFVERVREYEHVINAVVDHSRDFEFDYFAWNSYKQFYLLKNQQGVIVERLQFSLVRIALHLSVDKDQFINFYTQLSTNKLSPATPIRMNAGTVTGQMASCQLHWTKGDDTKSLLSTDADLCWSSRNSSGLGLGISNIRSKNSLLSGGGKASGVLKYLKRVNEGMRFWDQGGSRPGACAAYIEPWHADIEDILEMKKNTTKDELAARDLFSAIWMCDLYMKRLKEDSYWTLFCPNELKKAGIKPLYDIFGDEFEAEYVKAEKMVQEGTLKGRVIVAKELWNKIYSSMVETGTPYIVFKDTVNKKSNHMNIGTIKSSNLCTEIVEYTDENNTATCFLASLVLKTFVKDGIFNYEELGIAAKNAVQLLNRAIDLNVYNTPETYNATMAQRALGIGVQGLADVFMLMDIPFDSPEARELNKLIFETIYYHSVKESIELTDIYGPYKHFEGSPFSEGKLQFDLWGVEPSSMWDWSKLKADLVTKGIANSMLTTIMPTATSARALNSREKEEPIPSNMFTRKVKDGEYVIVNEYLINDLEKLDAWNDETISLLVSNQGSIQNINFSNLMDEKTEKHLKLKHRTIWEIPQKNIIDMNIIRGPFIDQTQSMNIHMDSPQIGKFTSAIFYAWEKGLKTGCYYFRTRQGNTGSMNLTGYRKVEVDLKVDKDGISCVGCES